METVKIICKGKTYKIKRKIITYVLNNLCNDDFSNADDTTILNVMKDYSLIDEVTLESMQNYKN